MFRPTFSYLSSDSLVVLVPTFSCFPSDSSCRFMPTSSCFPLDSFPRALALPFSLIVRQTLCPSRLLCRFLLLAVRLFGPLLSCFAVFVCTPSDSLFSPLLLYCCLSYFPSDSLIFSLALHVSLLGQHLACSSLAPVGLAPFHQGFSARVTARNPP